MDDNLSVRNCISYINTATITQEFNRNPVWKKTKNNRLSGTPVRFEHTSPGCSTREEKASNHPRHTLTGNGLQTPSASAMLPRLNKEDKQTRKHIILLGHESF